MRITTVLWLAGALAACGDPAGVTPDGGGDATVPGTPSITGTWQGFLPDPIDGRTRLELFLRDGPSGFSGTADLRDLGAVLLPVSGTVAPGGIVHGEVGPGLATFTGTVGADELTLLFTSLGGSEAMPPEIPPVTLVRDNPELAVYAVPRRDASGERELDYAYAPPEEVAGDWPVSSLAAEGIEEGPIVELVEAILAGDYPNADSVLIVRNGRLVLEEYFHGNRRDAAHVIQSVTKSVTSLLIGLAFDAGLITDLDRPVAEYFPEYAGTPWVDTPYGVTLHHTLSMSAGLRWNEDVPYTDPSNSAVQLGRAEDPVRHMLEQPLEVPPGLRFEYNSGLSMLLGGILSRATGTSVADWSRTRLFEPLGIEHYGWPTATGNEATGGGLRMRARDMAKIGQLILQRGRWNGTQLVSEAWIDLSTAPQAPGAFYGYQWWRGEAPLGDRTVTAVAAIGYGGQQIAVVPELELVIVHTSVDFDYRGADPAGQIERYIAPALLP
jgi:CubicO group peptidase (beta-lactamase class C family)